MKKTAIILSGGKGRRFGSEVPKQYLEIEGMSILGITLRAFEQSNVDEIVIVAAQDYVEACRELALRSGFRKVRRVIAGGAERCESVRNGLRDLAADSGGAGFRDIVLIHDGARPFIRPEVINQILDCIGEYGAVIAATPCTDTIKIADEEGFIAETTERARTWAAQTPQAFRTLEIHAAYEKILGSGHTEGITDDAMVYQMAYPDRRVRLIDAGPENFKITTRDDLIRAKGIMKERTEE